MSAWSCNYTAKHGTITEYCPSIYSLLAVFILAFTYHKGDFATARARRAAHQAYTIPIILPLPSCLSHAVTMATSANSKTPPGAANVPGGADHDLHCLTIKELETAARDCMDRQTRDYYNEGADDNSTLIENNSAYQKYRIRPRVLRDISAIDTSVNIFGQTNSVPFGVAPTAMQCLAHSDGELGTARACKSAGIVMGLSSFATSTLEDVANDSKPNANVLQLYLFEDKEHSESLIRRAKQAGYKAVLLTVDTPMLGRRNAEIRNQFTLPPHLEIANFQDPEKQSSEAKEQAEEMRKGGEGKKIWSPKMQKRKKSSAGWYDAEKGERVAPTGPITFHTHAANPTLCWEDSIPWLKKVCGDMEVWVKGIMTAEDAILAVEHGCDGIVV